MIRLGRNGGGPAVIVALGGVLFLIAVAHHATEIEKISVLGGPFGALVLDGVPALGLVYAGYWLSGTSLDVGATRRVAQWCLLGACVFVATIGLSIGIRMLEDRVVSEPLFTLLLAADIGALAGFVSGYYRTRALVDKRRAEDAVEGLALINSIIRHDLRNDLQVIGLNANLVAGDGVSAEDREAKAATIQQTVEQARERIDDTEAIAKTLNEDMDFEPIDLAAVVEEVAGHVEETHGVTVDTDTPGIAYVAGNKGVRSIVDNLVENAAEHNDSDDPRVEVGVGATNGRVRLVVRDNGPGLPEDARAALTGTDERDGAVGGLRIVRRLVSEYGGELSVADADPRGTEIMAELPASDGPSLTVDR